MSCELTFTPVPDVGYVPLSRILTINGVSYDLSQDRSWTVSAGGGGTVTSLTFNAPLTGGTITTSGTVGITQATTSTDGYLSSIDWNLFNGKQAALSGSGVVKSTSGTISYISGTSSQFIKADGSLDSSTYLTGNQTITFTASGDATTLATTGTTSLSPSFTVTGIRGKTITLATGFLRYDGAGWIFDNTSYGTGSVTSVTLAAGTGISLSGTNPITTSGTITVTNSAPDQTVSLTGGTGISTSGTYPNFTITNSSPVSGSSGTFGLSIVADSATGISSGSKGFLQLPYAGVIASYTILSSTSGTIQVDLKKSTYSGFPSTSSITGGNYIALSSTQKNTDSTLTSWTTSFSAGDIMEFSVVAASTLTRINIIVKVTKS